MTCANCGTDNREGRKFCSECGTSLASGCPACGAANEPGEKFCGECGATLASTSTGVPPAAAPAAERRLVSVLFADLVGFTTLSESRDPEEVRELLSRYFDTCRRLIELYGGTVEKFIGDAVMAVWGTPTATEDDAERAVRAALDLVAAVSALGDEIGAPELAARAGVLTGEAAVTIGAEGQGMVAGDLVNTAARIQSAANPGSVLVGDSTRRASELTVVYEDAGVHELKGKEEAAQLFRALRVASGRRGALKSTGLEPPFVGRDRELRLVKELFHASAEERTAHLVSAMGIAGIGKSRLAWEFYKYFDGLVDNVYWHRGRCLAYGEGVTYWALADMVRMRCPHLRGRRRCHCALEARRDAHRAHARSGRAGVRRADAREPARDRRGAVLARAPRPLRRLAALLRAAREHVPHRPRVRGHAVGRREPARVRRVPARVVEVEPALRAGPHASRAPRQAAELGRRAPQLHVAPSRPTLGIGDDGASRRLRARSPRATSRADLGPGRRSPSVRRRDGADAAGSRVAGAGGFGLPADRRDPLARSARDVAWARGLAPRRATRGGAPLAPGRGRPRQDLHAPGTRGGRRSDGSGARPAARVTRAQGDPRRAGRPDVRPSTASTASSRTSFATSPTRRSRRRSAAPGTSPLPHTSSTHSPNEDEIAEVLASHYLDAYTALPDAEDAAEVKAKARAALARAGDRAESLGASGEALRYLAQAAELTDDALERAALFDRAGWLAIYVPDWPEAERLLGESIALYTVAGETRTAARVSGRLATVEGWQGKIDAAIPRAEAAFAALEEYEPGEELAGLAATLAGDYFFRGENERALEKADFAIELAEALGSPEILARAFSAKALVAQTRRPEEAIALRRHVLAIAREHGLHEMESNALFNLSDLMFQRDRYEDALAYLADALQGARRIGHRPGEWSLLGETSYPLYMLGRWDEALAAFAEVPEERLFAGTTAGFLTSLPEIHVARGEIDRAAYVVSLFADFADAEDVQRRMYYLAGAAVVARAKSAFEDAAKDGFEAAALSRETHGEATQAFKIGLIEAIESALALGNSNRADELVASIDAVPPGLRSPYLGAQALRFRARLALSEDEAIEQFDAAAKRFRELGVLFWLAVTLLEHGELTGDETLLDEAREIFEQLDARPWLERLEGARSHEKVTA